MTVIVFYYLFWVIFAAFISLRLKGLCYGRPIPAPVSVDIQLIPVAVICRANFMSVIDFPSLLDI